MIVSKSLIAGLVMFSTISLANDNHSFMPNNDLWRQDCLPCESMGIDQDMFNKIIDAGKEAFAPYAEENDEELIINAKWDDSTVNANCSRYYGKVTVNMYGGLARRKEVIPEGFALVLSHELSHAYGGTPYVYEYWKMSAEGQSDYAGAAVAYKKIAALVPELNQDIESDDFIREVCGEDLDCTHSLEGGKSLAKLLSVLSGEKNPSYETPDPTVVEKTILSYPKTVQCRLDTYLAGTINKPRPSCWFKE